MASLKVVWQDKREAGLEDEHGQRFTAHLQVSHATGRRRSKWVSQCVSMRNMSQTLTVEAANLAKLVSKLEAVENLAPTSVRF